MTTSWDTFDDDVTRPYRPSDGGSAPDTGAFIDDDLTTPFRPGAAGVPTASRLTQRRPTELEIEADGVAVVLPDGDRPPLTDGFPPATEPATAPMWAQAPPGTFRPWEPTPRPTLVPTAMVIRSRRGGRARPLVALVVAALALFALAAVLVLRWLGWPG